MSPEASIVVPLDGGPDQALRCFSALAGLPQSPSHEVVVVDNASVGLEPLLGQLAGDVTVARSDGRVGLSEALALGIERCGAELVVLLPRAPEVASGWLDPLVSRLRDPKVGAAASVAAGAEGAHPVAAPALALRRADLTAIGGMPAVPEGLELAALCAALGSSAGPVESVRASIVYPAGARNGGARRTPGEDPELTVVIPTLDAGSERVRRCVAALQRCTDVAHEIVVLDNGAPPQGFTAPVNAGLRAGRGAYSVVMNDDVEVLPGWWTPLRGALDDGASAAFPVTVDGANRTDFAAWCFAMSRDGLERFAHAPGELFDPRFTVWFQDTDLLERLRAAGAPPRMVPEARIRHGLSETVATQDPALRAWIDAEIARDRDAFAAKHPGSSAALPGAA
jgi:GT2 family glycosyltransferase